MTKYALRMARKKSFGEQLADARRLSGMSQEELGEAVGAAGRTVSTWETGVHLPTKRVQATLEALYGWQGGTIAHALRTGSALPAVAATFGLGRPSPVEEAGEKARRLAVQDVADSLSQLSERMTALENRVRQIEGSRPRARNSR